MRRAAMMILAFSFGLNLTALAQVKQERQIPFREQLRPVGTGSLVGVLGLDPSKFRMQHSYTLSVMSLGGHTLTQGLYLNTMTYQFSPKLVAQLQLGMLHQPLGGTISPALSNRFFVSRAQVLYRPTRNMRLYFQFNAYPYGYYPTYDDEYRYWDRPFPHFRPEEY